MSSCRLMGKIIRVDGDCAAGHFVGEEFDLTLFSEETKCAHRTHRAPNICSFLYDIIFPYILTLQFGGSFPWSSSKDEIEVGCPDNYKVVIKIRRIRE